MSKMHRTMQGRMVDMEKLMNQNELMPAIGNVKVNARGDELGPGGKIVRKREEVMAEYYENNPKATPEQRGPVRTKNEQPPIVEATHIQANKKDLEDDDESKW